MDVHVPQAITEQLRRRGVDVLTAFEDQSATLADSELLERARVLGRVIFTQSSAGKGSGGCFEQAQDIRFKALAENCQRQGQPFAGLLFGHQLRGTIGQFVRDLELIAQASKLDEWHNTVEHLPY